MKSDYDGAWKDLLHRRLPEILTCYFPAISAAIDWSQPPDFRDQELRELLIEAPEGSSRVAHAKKPSMRPTGSSPG